MQGRNGSKLARSLDLHRATISSWRKGKGVPDALTAAKVATALDVSVDYLLGLSDSPHQIRERREQARDLKIPELFIIDEGDKGVVIARVVAAEMSEGRMRRGDTVSLKIEAIIEEIVED